MKCPPTVYRFSERLFRRYEPIFHRILTVHGRDIQPKEIIYFKLSGSPNTHKARCSDAYNSLIENKWTTSLDVKRLREIWPSLTIRTDPETSQCLVVAKYSKVELTSPQKTDLRVHNPTELEFRALLVLQHYQTFSSLALEITGLSPELISKLNHFSREFPNVVFDFPNEDDRTHIILI